ncbi:hypothetical protein [Aliiruegeria lutimaris]|uniref:Transposase n=1 Tax=Aliiruegeria lutimaris TaxID=571298 RepID=A0A1G9QEU6_9RHOB|nr:hypothetical protein [Aliiruegeria lutimaris]SDM09592.1 hypothetical protein SAMN04488026_11721 [Aliiruegeria lutimaris]
MFLRKKKVGRYEYFQIVESIRNKKGPRLKVHASLGRTDKVENSGALESLFASIAKYSKNRPLLSDTSSLKVRAMPREVMQELVVQQLLILAELNTSSKRSRTQIELPASFKKIVRQALFDENTSVDLDFLSSIGQKTDLSKNLSYLFCQGTNANGAEPIIVHIDNPCGKGKPISPMKGLTTATAINSRGEVMLVEYWLNILPLPSMIEKYVRRLSKKIPHKRLVIVLDRTLVNKPLVEFFAKKAIQFVLPLYEPSRALNRMPDEIIEMHPSSKPFDDVGTFRYIRAIDYCTASYERAVRETQLFQLKSVEKEHLSQSRGIKRAEKILEKMGERDGNSILATNVQDGLEDILNYYLLGENTRKLLAATNSFCAKIALHLDMPRDTKSILDGAITLQLLTSNLTKPFLDKVSNAAGKRVSWSQVAKLVNSSCPITIADGEFELIFMPTEPEILQTIFAALEIDLEMITQKNCVTSAQWER